MRLSITFFVSGFILLIFGVAMLIPCMQDFVDGRIDYAYSFLLSAGVTCFFAALFMLTFYNKWDKLSVREMYLTTSFVWLLVCSFCALPFFFAPTPLNYTDSFFETMSGLTTMGASVIPDLNIESRGILLWRGMLQWIGGLGIIVIALAILPLLRIGGMQLFSTESSDKSGKALPKTSQIIGTLIIVYIVLTIACFLSLHLAGLDLFEAITYTLSTVPTGGFSPRNSSAMELSALLQWLITLFMFLSGLPLFFFYFCFIRDWDKIRSDMQVKTYAGFVLAAVFILTAWMKYTYPDRDVLDALRNVAFTIVSILTTTGFVCEDFDTWGPFASMFLMFIIPIGACSGSTTGGIKIFRFNILYLYTTRYLRSKILPHGVFVAKYDGKPLTEDITASVMVFMTIFFVSFTVSALLLAFFGLNFTTAVSGTFSALGNVGVGIGKEIGPPGTFATLPDGAKWILSIDMMLGRLEYMTVFVLLFPLAWRREKKNMSTAAF